MSEVVVLVIGAVTLGGGLVLGFLISEKNNEIKILEAEIEADKKIEKAVSRHVELLKEHNELLEKIHEMGNKNASPSEFNELWKKLRSQMSVN